MNISTIGRTSENRDIKLVTVNGDRGLPKIFIDAGIHARYRSTPGSYPPGKWSLWPGTARVAWDF